ncbi:uncharacterized protein TNCV_1365941 [Trichonephila clavipes]|nr:uncharacterized protein TNCV_1365941 [Trichonephila clavipes]
MVCGAISYDTRSTLVVILSTLTVNLYFSLVIQPIVLPFMNIPQGGVFFSGLLSPSHRYCTQRALQSIDMLLWPARPPDLTPIEHAWDIIERQLHHPSVASTNRPSIDTTSTTSMELHTTK